MIDAFQITLGVFAGAGVGFAVAYAIVALVVVVLERLDEVFN